MSISTLNQYRNKILAPYQTVYISKSNQGSNAGRMASFWTATPGAGGTPSTAAAPDRSTTGALGQLNSNGTQRLAELVAGFSHGGMTYLWICDRLSHQGGLSGTAGGEQTTNLPTAALTRSTNGVGVMAALEIYTVIGTTAVDATLRYDNDAGSTDLTSPPVTIGGASPTARNPFRLVIMPLNSGDKGVKKVSGVTLSASTGTAGNFGVTLFKPLYCLPVYNSGGQHVEIDGVFGGGHLPAVPADACLFFVFISQDSNSLFAAGLKFVED